MKIKSYAVLAALGLLSACGASNNSTAVWVDREKIQGKTFKKLLVMVMSGNVNARTMLENSLADAATQKGYTVVKSMDIMPPTFSSGDKPDEALIKEKVKASGCDGVVIASLQSKEEQTRYVPGTSRYDMMPYRPWIGSYWGFYGRFYPGIYQPGYYTEDKSYFMQTNFYDLRSDDLLWSVQSEIFNPVSLKGFAKDYTRSVQKQLAKAGIGEK
ncbi:MAG: hypothetical protein MUF24_06235 [Chitinophagaceae bacterium]|jgi:hypothetical protein|nr:hypothetical protein [Chitinophagaceae bacterium]